MDSQWQQAIDIFTGPFGRRIEIAGNADGRNNGIIDWRYGTPVGQINHHFGASADPANANEQARMLRDGYATDSSGGFLPGPVVPTFLGTDMLLRLNATGPCNHAGSGSQVVVDRVRSGQAPAGPAANVGLGDDRNMNDTYVGTEVQNPGDGSGYPDEQIAILVDWNAALCIAFDWGDDAHACIHHYESTARKPDMSWRGGVNGDGGPELRRRVAARIAQYRNGFQTSEEDDDMPLTDKDLDAIADRVWAKQFGDPRFLTGSRQSMAEWVASGRQFSEELPARVAGITAAIVGADFGKVKDWIAQGANAVKLVFRSSGNQRPS